MKHHRRSISLLFVILTLAGGCSRSVAGPPKNLPAPLRSTALGRSDVFEILVVGEKDLPKEYRVQPDGSISFPYLGHLQVQGKEPQEVEQMIRDGLVANKILVDPQVTVVIRAYSSKKVKVIGAVKKPGSYVWTEDMTIVDAISQAGWFESLGEQDRVRLTRIVAPGHRVSVDINAEQIANGKQGDIPLQPGDTVLVGQKVF
jgi:protein involved in polysaccharide export with SLBB domain